MKIKAVQIINFVLMGLKKERAKTISATSSFAFFGVSRDAFTFIELILVVTLIGILVAVSIPQFRRTFDGYILENFVKDFYYASRYLQASAVAQGKIFYLQMSSGKGFVFGNKQNDALVPVAGRLAHMTLPEGLAITVTPPEKTTIYFYPDGSSDAVEISFENRHGERMTLSIQGATSGIKIK